MVRGRGGRGGGPMTAGGAWFMMAGGGQLAWLVTVVDGQRGKVGDSWED